MDIYEMHVLFRTLGQQQGLQLVRGILPESIDEFINEAIIQNVRVALIGTTQGSKDVITPQYTKISPFSAFHTLFCTEESDLTIDEDGGEFTLVLQQTPMFVTNFVVKYKDKKKYDCRLIESERLYQTLNDYLNRASRDYPIVSLVNGKSDKEFTLSLFTGDSQKDVAGLVTTYVRMPASVKFDEEYYDAIDSGETENVPENHSVNCDLPEHLHRSIVELAVEIWLQTLGLTSKQPQENNNNKNTQ